MRDMSRGLWNASMNSTYCRTESHSGPLVTSRSLRVAVVERDRETRLQYQRCLEDLNHEAKIVSTGKEAARLPEQWQPDLLIAELTLLRNGIITAGLFCQERPIPIIVTTDRNDMKAEKQLPEGSFAACLVKPFADHSLGPTIDTALRDFDAMQAMQAEIQQLREETLQLTRSLEESQLVEQAVIVISRASFVPANKARERLRTYAARHDCSLIEAARFVVESGDPLAGLEVSPPAPSLPRRRGRPPKMPPPE